MPLEQSRLVSATLPGEALWSGSMPLSRASIELHLLLCHVLAVRVRESSKPCGMAVTIIITILLL